MKMKTHSSKIYGMQQKRSKREIYSDTNLPQKIRKISNKQPNLIPKGDRKRKTSKTQSQQKERNHKDMSRNK